VQTASSICSKINNVQCFPARSTRPGLFSHADTIHLGRCWNSICEPLVLVDDCHRKIYPYAMKDRSGASVADKRRGHCLKLRSTLEGIQYFSLRTHLQSDQGSEFIDRDVLNWSKEVGAIQSFSCPGDLGKWQNSACERKIKDLGAIMRSIMHRSEAPSAAAAYAMYHAADIMNALPTSANVTLDACAGLSPNEVKGCLTLTSRTSMRLDHNASSTLTASIVSRRNLMLRPQPAFTCAEHITLAHRDM
jgi:hypothetical protein